MILARALALFLATASPDSLPAARTAFAAGDYARAERLALEAVEAQPAPALYLVGLARFRDGRPAEALAALDQAEAGADSPATWHFNRAACLYQLARPAEAGAEFIRAAEDPELAPLALVNAGFAALDTGDAALAGRLARRARLVASGAALALVEELEQALDPGPAAAPEAPEAPARPVQEPAAPTSQVTGEVHVEGGWDSDALRASSGALERPRQRDGTSSPLIAAAAGLTWRGPVLGAAGQASYSFSQLAYQARAAEDRSEQQHDLLLSLRLAPAESLHLELAVIGQYALAGLSDLRGLQLATGGRLAAAFDATAWQTSRLELSFIAKDGIGSEFASLDGERLEASAAHEVRWERLAWRAGYRYRREQIGTVTTRRQDAPVGASLCPMGCTVTDREPLGYSGHMAWLSARLQASAWLWIDAGGGVEWREYDHDLRTDLVWPDGSRLEVGLRQRRERRGSTSWSAAARLTPWLSLNLRHDWLVSGSTLQPAAGGTPCPPTQPMCPPAGLVEKWDKHVVTLGASLAW